MASKALLVFALLLASAFLVNCAQQPQPNADPADPSNDDPNPDVAGAGGSGNPAQQGPNGGGRGYGNPSWYHPHRCRWGCCQCGYYRCQRCC